MTTIEKIQGWLRANTGQHNANTIAEGINAAASTVRKVLKTLRDEGKVAWSKEGAVTYYTDIQADPQVKAQAETPTKDVIVNTASKSGCPRALMTLIRARAEAHRTAMMEATSRGERKRHHKLYSRRMKRLTRLEQQHGTLQPA